MADVLPVILAGLTDGEENGGRAAGPGGEGGIIVEFEGEKPYAMVLLDKKHLDTESVVTNIISKSTNNMHKGAMIYFLSAILNVTLT